MAFNNFQKHFNAVVKTASDARPALKHWLLTPEYWYVTDSMRAIKVPNTIPVSKDAVINPNTMSSVDNNVNTGMSYPSIDRLFADLSTDQSVITIAPTKLDLRMLNALKNEDRVLLVPDKNEIRVTDVQQKSVATSFQLTAPVPCTKPVSINPKFLLDTINALVDTSGNEFAIRMESPIQPIQFESKDISYIVTPIRVPNKQ